MYLATVPLSVEPYSEASIFLTERVDNELLVSGGRLYRGDLGPVEVLVHGRTTRGDVSLPGSALTERAIVLGLEQDDWYTSGEGERTVLGRHKIGGRPSIFRAWDVEDEAAGLLRAGFSQILQLDFPGPEDDRVGGDWPFGDGMFHLLAREPFRQEDWACFWEN